jgi:hypothetical protein
MLVILYCCYYGLRYCWSGGDVELNPGPAGAMLKRLYICHANIRSIQRCNDKLDHIKEEFCGRFDVITLSETWLKPTDGVDLMGRSVYHLDGYQDPIRRDRVGSRGGGVLAWVSNSLVCKRRNDLEIENAELMWLEIRCSNQKFLLAVAYRTDDQGNFWDILQESYIRAVRLGIHYIIITGDLNADPSTHHGNKLMEFIEANNLTKLINVPTRITETSASELDQILTNCSSIIQEVDLLPPVSYNDHHTVSVRLNFKIAKPHSYNRLMWDFGRADYMAFTAKIAQTNWETCFDYDDIDCVAQNWTDTLLNIARETIPNKMVTVRPWDKPFYNGYLRRLRRNKNRAHNLAKSDNTSAAWQQFSYT